MEIKPFNFRLPVLITHFDFLPAMDTSVQLNNQSHFMAVAFSPQPLAPSPQGEGEQEEGGTESPSPWGEGFSRRFSKRFGQLLFPFSLGRRVRVEGALVRNTTHLFSIFHHSLIFKPQHVEIKPFNFRLPVLITHFDFLPAMDTSVQLNNQSHFIAIAFAPQPLAPSPQGEGEQEEGGTESPSPWGEGFSRRFSQRFGQLLFPFSLGRRVRVEGALVRNTTHLLFSPQPLQKLPHLLQYLFNILHHLLIFKPQHVEIKPFNFRLPVLITHFDFLPAMDTSVQLNNQSHFMAVAFAPQPLAPSPQGEGEQEEGGTESPSPWGEGFSRRFSKRFGQLLFEAVQKAPFLT